MAIKSASLLSFTLPAFEVVHPPTPMDFSRNFLKVGRWIEVNYGDFTLDCIASENVSFEEILAFP